MYVKEGEIIDDYRNACVYVYVNSEEHKAFFDKIPQLKGLRASGPSPTASLVVVIVAVIKKNFFLSLFNFA
jgi:hypothetical protein